MTIVSISEIMTTAAQEWKTYINTEKDNEVETNVEELNKLSGED